MSTLLERDKVEAAQSRLPVPIMRPTSHGSDAITYDRPASYYEQWSEALKAFRDVETLGDNWDDSGSKAPSPHLLDNVLDLMAALREGGFPAPHDFSVGTRGEIALCWFGGRENYFEIRVHRPFVARWMAAMPGCPTRHGQGVDAEAARWLATVLKTRWQ